MSVPFVDGFQKPSEQDSISALGCFPWDASEQERKRALPPSDLFKQPSFGTSDPEMYAQGALDQLNNRCLFENSGKQKRGNTKTKRARPSRPWNPLPNPINDNDWLATG
jgi:hypothetical protein